MSNVNLNDIIDDFEFLADELEARGLSTRTYLGYLPKTYVEGDTVIRLLNPSNSTMTSEYVRMDRTYQIVLFSERPVTMFQRVNDVMAFFTSQVKFPVKDGFLTINDRINFSEPFLTEGEKMYASIGVIEAYVTRKRPQEEYGKVGEFAVVTVNDEDLHEGNEAKI